MKIIVVYESMYGNTKVVGDAIADGLRDVGEVMAGSVDEISPDDVVTADLIVAGGPTHAHGMARQNAHDQVANMPARHKYRPVLPGTESLRGWIERLPEGRTTCATFDTRFRKPAWLTGSAAVKIARRMRAKGYDVVASESFFVEHTDGPLNDGERERAASWGKSLASLEPART